jgi:hypothetical protein
MHQFRSKNRKTKIWIIKSLIISIVNKGKDEGEVDDDDDRAKRKEKEKDSSSQCALFSARRKKGRTKQSRIHFGGVYFVK